MDAADPEIVELIRSQARQVPDVLDVDHIRVRWIGHELHAALDVTVPGTMSLAEAHHSAELVHHRLLHEVPRLAEVTIHTDPAHDPGRDPHALTAHHRRRSA